MYWCTESACIPVVIVLLMLYPTDVCSSITLDTSACASPIHDLDHDESLTIKWEGETIPVYCRIGFRAPDSSSTTCIAIKKFRFYNCGFFISIYTDSTSEFPEMTYSCSSKDIDTEHCIYKEQTIYLNFAFNYTGSISFTPNVKLTVRVEKGDGSILEETVSFTTPLGAVAFVIFCIAFIVFACKSKCKDFWQGILECVSGVLCGICGVITKSCCCLKDTIHDCVASVNTECRQVQVPVCCQPRLQEPEVTVVATTVVSHHTDTRTDPPDFDDVMALEMAHASAHPSDSGLAPPPDAPPPSYYDVVTGNVSVSNA